MKLTEEALKTIDTPRIRIGLAMALNVTEQTIIRYIDVNSDNLTKAAALKVIKDQTGLTEETLLQSENA